MQYDYINTNRNNYNIITSGVESSINWYSDISMFYSNDSITSYRIDYQNMVVIKMYWMWLRWGSIQPQPTTLTAYRVDDNEVHMLAREIL